MKSRSRARRRAFLPLVVSICLVSSAPGAEEWELVLQQEIRSKYSGDRHNALKQVDTTSVKGLRALWAVLAQKDPDVVDWYVREGAYEALVGVEGDDAEEEIVKTLKQKSSRYDLAKEAIVFSVIWKLRKQFVKDFVDNEIRGKDEDKEAHAKYLLRKTRGLDYFELILPVARKIDPDGKRFEWIRLAFDDSSPRVRRAAITGFLAYPDVSVIPLLLDNLERLAKSESTKRRNYREWVLTRFALETLTGMYFREQAEDWRRWWDGNKDSFSLDKRIAEKKAEEKEGDSGRTTVVKRGGVEVRVKMKVAGDPDSYPILVLPWRGYEPDYFRPYFHGVEEFLRVYYLEMPQIGDFKGLARDANSNFVKYPTELLAGALADTMSEADIGHEKFAVLCHGPEAGTLGMYLTARYPGRVTHLVFVNPRAAGKSFSDALDNVEREGRRRRNDEIVNGVKNRRIDGRTGKPLYEPGDPAEAAGLGRALNNLRFADPTEPEVGALRFFYDLPGGTQVLVDNSWNIQNIFERKMPRLPVLVMMGEKNPWTPIAEMTRVSNGFRAKVVKFPRSGEMPFLSDPDRFTTSLEAFFKKAVASHEKEKEKEADEGR